MESKSRKKAYTFWISALAIVGICLALVFVLMPDPDSKTAYNGFNSVYSCTYRHDYLIEKTETKPAIYSSNQTESALKAYSQKFYELLDGISNATELKQNWENCGYVLGACSTLDEFLAINLYNSKMTPAYKNILKQLNHSITSVSLSAKNFYTYADEFYLLARTSTDNNYKIEIATKAYEKFLKYTKDVTVAYSCFVDILFNSCEQSTFVNELSKTISKCITDSAKNIVNYSNISAKNSSNAFYASQLLATSVQKSLSLFNGQTNANFIANYNGAPNSAIEAVKTCFNVFPKEVA